MQGLFKDMVVDFAVEDIPWPGGRTLYALWLSLCDGDTLPARRHFHPRDTQSFDKYMTVLDVEYDPLRFRNRMVGVALCAILGRDPTGTYQDELPGSASLIDRYTWIIENRRPYFCVDLPLQWAGAEYISYSTLVLPLASDGQVIDKLIACLEFSRPS